MKSTRRHPILLLVFVTLSCLAQAQSNNIVIGHIDSLSSKILHEKRKIWVHVPDSYLNGVYAKRRYPVVYLLDGTDHFSSVVGMIEQLSTVNGNTICPEMIVVGIPNTNRLRDLTPTPGGRNDSIGCRQYKTEELGWRGEIHRLHRTRTDSSH